jgi:hypothetical protein
MKRLLAIFSCLSMILFIVIAVLWVRSYQVGDFLHYDHWTLIELRWHESLFAYESGKGGFALSRYSYTNPAEETETHIAEFKEYLANNHDFTRGRMEPDEEKISTSESATLYKFLGFAAWNDPIGTHGEGEQGVMVPAWFLACVFAVLPLRWSFVTWRKRRRMKRGWCERCGYDLTCNVSGTCPECGTTPTATHQGTKA